MLTRKIATIVNRFSSDKLNSLSLLSNQERQVYLQQIEENAVFDYKTYPSLPHQDPKSSEYIASQLDEYHDKVQVEEYNNVINNLKNDLKVQRQVWSAIANLDRPYKRGTPGLDRNLNQDGPTKLQLPDLGFPRRDIMSETQFTFQNEDRFIANTPWHARIPFQHILEWQKQRFHRPVTRDFNHGKGYKYDVPIKPQEKYQYVADRLGHPQFFGTPIERLFKLEKDLYHPNFIDQPFVRTPSQYPNQQLNFEQGQVIYQNTRVLQWIRAFQVGNVALLAYGGVFLPLNMIFKTNLIVEKGDQLWIGQQHLWNPYGIDSVRLFTPISACGVFYLVYSMMKIITQFGGQYAVKVSYSKDKELLFVKRINNYGQLEEDVYETAHLEILPPRQRSAVQDLSSQDADGLWRIACLNTKRTILLYNNDQYWNRKLKTEFINSKLNFWDKSYYGYNRKEQAERNAKWRQQVFESLEQQALPGK